MNNVPAAPTPALTRHGGGGRWRSGRPVAFTAGKQRLTATRVELLRDDGHGKHVRGRYSGSSSFRNTGAVPLPLVYAPEVAQVDFFEVWVR